jgi:tetratricopeptide (TPR) repeat protein
MTSIKKIIAIFLPSIFSTPGFTQADSLYKTAIKKADATYDFRWTYRDETKDIVKYEAARVLYSKALKIKPDEVYPVERIREIDYELSYSISRKIIFTADSLFDLGQYQQAKKYYEKADSLYLKSDTKQRIELLSEALQIKDMDTAIIYIKLIIKADSLAYKYMLGTINEHYAPEPIILENVIKEYKKAMAIKANSKYIIDRMDEIKSLQKYYGGKE